MTDWIRNKKRERDTIAGKCSGGLGNFRQKFWQDLHKPKFWLKCLFSQNLFLWHFLSVVFQLFLNKSRVIFVKLWIYLRFINNTIFYERDWKSPKTTTKSLNSGFGIGSPSHDGLMIFSLENVYKNWKQQHSNPHFLETNQSYHIAIRFYDYNIAMSKFL